MFRSFEPDDGLNRFAPGQAGGRIYDGAGRRTRLTHPDNQAFTYAYDNLSRLSGVYQGTGTGTPLATFTYASNGLVSSRTEGSGVSSATYGWDDIGRLTNQADAFSGGTNNVTWAFAYNPASQIVTETRSNDNYGLAKTNATLSYSVNGLNQYTAAGGASLAYDANGNLTDDGPATYTYDIENRLVKAVAGATTTNLVYDPLGRLFEINQGTSQTTTRFLNDGDALVIEYGSVNQVSDRYVHGSNAAADDPLVWYEGGGLFIKHWLHADHLGSIVAVTNSSGGSPSINRYDEYGVPSATNIGRFQYTGQAWIAELGLYYYKARFYSPALGRFMQTDPVGYESGMNLYAYVEGDPVNRFDVNGKQSCPANTGVIKCPDVRPPPLDKSLQLRREVLRTPSSGDAEKGGQMLKNIATGAISNRTGPEAGVGTAGEFAHNPAPRGHTTLQLSHEHLAPSGQKGVDAETQRIAQNAPSRLDQEAMQLRNVSVQTIGPDVTTTLYRVDSQDYLRVDIGNPEKIPDLSAQKIIVCTGDVQCPQ